SPQDEQILRYQNQKTADKLNNRNQGNIGVLIPSVTMPIYPGILRGIEDECHRQGFTIFLGNYDANPQKEKNYMKTFLDKGIRGLIISPSYNSLENNFYKTLIDLDVPVVLNDISLPAYNFNLVATDNIAAAYRACSAICSKKSRRIGFLCYEKNTYSSRQREAGYRMAMEDHGLAFHHSLIFDAGPGGIYTDRAIRQIKRTAHLDGLLIANEPDPADLAGLLSVLSNLRLALFCYTANSLTAANIAAYVVQPKYEIGCQSAQLLCESIQQKNNQNNSLQKTILISAEVKCL
ncbi:MAG TPA: hypothetical protein DC049_14915, partial [Spirochaetia bacterium]|nr:hypothetical protein [Spirochaetia bacterium]